MGLLMNSNTTMTEQERESPSNKIMQEAWEEMIRTGDTGIRVTYSSDEPRQLELELTDHRSRLV
jgi:hypothetical protein